MVYVMSDLHGMYELYKRMLDEIRLSDEDTLYILGDVVDRGEGGMKILLDLEGRKNIIPLMGNHDLMAYLILSRLNAGIREGELRDLQGLINAWLYDGGRVTFNEFKALSREDRARALFMLDGFRNYAEVKVGGIDYVLSHAAISGYTEGRPLSEYNTEDFIYERCDYTRPFFDGRVLVSGHTPTAAIEGATEGRIYRTRGHIAVDCGAVFGFGLGCLCLDNGKEFYVK